jgi:hypothetical protein
MKTFTLTFGLRDWKRGSQLLLSLGHTDDLMLTECHTLDFEDWQHEDLLDELHELDLEFTLEEKED